MASALLLLATFTIFSLWEVGARMFTRSDSQSVSQRQALKFADRFTRETQSSTLASMTVGYPSGNPPQGDLVVSFLTDQDAGDSAVVDSGSGQPVYQAWIVYSLNLTGQTLTRLRLPLATPSMLTSALPLGTVFTDIATNTGSSQVVLQNAVSWQALDYNSGQPTVSLQNPASYAVALTNLPYKLQFRNRLLQ